MKVRQCYCSGLDGAIWSGRFRLIKAASEALKSSLTNAVQQWLMARYRTPRPRSAAVPPADANEGAVRVRAALVKLFDRGDGTGADWHLMLESLYRVGFQIVDQQGANVPKSLLRRVHEAAETRLTDGYADGSRPTAIVSPVDSSSSNIGAELFNPLPPR